VTRIAANTSALIALAVCDAVSFLDVLFDEVKVSPAVLAEIAVPDKPGADTLRSYPQDKVVAVAAVALRLPAGRLGQGEREAIALAQQMRADFLGRERRG
jgi:predicted nucleic acid-binding protein